MRKIMIVDDAEISNFILKKMIEKIGDRQPVCDYTNPQIAIGEIEKINPLLLFLDLNMPGIDGWQFLDHMEKRGINIPVYILTSSTCELDKIRAADYAIVQDFLIKPANALNLKAILEVELCAAA